MAGDRGRAENERVFCGSVLRMAKGDKRKPERTIAQNVTKINYRPKKVLNYKTPANLFKQELQKVLHLT